MLLYLHIPFCETKCPYCAFTSYSDHHNLQEAYLQSLLRQLQAELQGVESLETIYIGGGTPSTMPLRLLEPLFDLLQPYQPREITIEANPTASREWIEGVASFANRISFGVQSFQPQKLRLLGRSHTPREAIERIEWAAGAGFEQISLDLIYECSCDTLSLLKADLDQALQLPITHLSAYSLTIEPGTPFAAKPERHRPDPEQGYFIKTYLQEHLPQYEVSNFGTPSRHNLGYWELRQYIGVGCGAVGFRQNRRLYTHTDLHRYLAQPLFYRVEELTPQELQMEQIFLGLRSCVGVPQELVDGQRAQILVEEGLLFLEGGRFYNANYFLADELALFLLS
ncbi:MAG: coproporphyrinogen III oxidase [Nitratiruptor sp.]|nr:coproporphyrinogen III oxidase [Nitratiruptor sp.]NPA83936.1 coproporphyrinogen III oxidase family protein [Campylobacterota bacterium]